jgi:hypothetical protein
MKRRSKYLLIIIILLVGSFQITAASNDRICSLKTEISASENFEPSTTSFLSDIPDSTHQSKLIPVPELKPIRVYKAKTNSDQNTASVSDNDTSIFSFTIEMFVQMFRYIF